MVDCYSIDNHQYDKITVFVVLKVASVHCFFKKINNLPKSCSSKYSGLKIEIDWKYLKIVLVVVHCPPLYCHGIWHWSPVHRVRKNWRYFLISGMPRWEHYQDIITWNQMQMWTIFLKFYKSKYIFDIFDYF